MSGQRKRPIGGRQYVTHVAECEEDRQAREAQERGVRCRQSGLRTTEPLDPDEPPVFDGREPGNIFDRRGR